jgi:hypothetical protein
MTNTSKNAIHYLNNFEEFSQSFLEADVMLKSLLYAKLLVLSVMCDHIFIVDNGLLGCDAIQSCTWLPKIRKVGNHLQDYTASQPRRQQAIFSRP